VASDAGHVGLLRQYLAPQRAAASIMAVFLLLSIGLALAGPKVASHFIQLIELRANESALIGIALLFLLVTSAHQATKALATYWSQRVGWTATNELRGDLMDHLLHMDLDFHENRSSGELIERVDGDVNEINEFFSSFVAVLVGNLLLLIGILVMLSTVDLRIGLAFAVVVVIGMAGLIYVGRVGTPQWKADREESALFYGYLSETLRATEDLRSSGGEPYAMARFLRRLRVWLPIKLRATAWASSVWVGSIGVFTAITVIAYAFGGRFYLAGELDLSGVYLVVAYALMLMAPMEAIKNQLAYLQQATAALIRVRELLAVRSTLADGPAEIPSGPLFVEFDDVRFSYPKADPAAPRPKALDGVSFQLPAGRVLALIGRTGAGKSTIAHLIFRMYDPQSGAVRIGGHDLRGVRLASLRDRIGWVTQDVHIFDASLRDNLTFFDPGVPEERLVEVLGALGRAEWLAGLPDGLDTRISGGSLSGGEAQLVAFARVFLADPGLVILDEASSRLDAATEQLLENALDELLDGRTAIVIAHRLETVRRADDVLMISDGRVVEHGSAAALLADPDSRYAALRRMGTVSS
jgi:ABC-type multidrug transport system fused ATPase/permease subunit